LIDNFAFLFNNNLEQQLLGHFDEWIVTQSWVRTPERTILSRVIELVVFFNVDSVIRFFDHGKEDFQLLGFKGQHLLGVLAEGGGPDLLRQFPEVWREFETLDVASEVKRMADIDRLLLSYSLGWFKHKLAELADGQLLA